MTLRLRKDNTSRRSHTGHMTTKRLMLLLAVAMAVTVTVVQTRRGTPADAGSRTFQVTGVVTSPIAEGRVMVAHDDIPGYMPAMTMPFAVDADVTPSLAAGDRVRFTLRVTAEQSRAEGFRVTGHDAAVAAALRPETRRGPKRLKKGKRDSGVLAHDVGGATVDPGGPPRSRHGDHVRLHQVSST